MGRTVMMEAAQTQVRKHPGSVLVDLQAPDVIVGESCGDGGSGGEDADGDLGVWIATDCVMGYYVDADVADQEQDEDEVAINAVEG